MKYEEEGYDPRDLENYKEPLPHFFTVKRKCSLCGQTGSIEDKVFTNVTEGQPIPYMDYVICQNCGHKELASFTLWKD